MKNDNYRHIETLIIKNEMILEEGNHSTEVSEELQREIQRLKNKLHNN